MMFIRKQGFKPMPFVTPMLEITSWWLHMIYLESVLPSGIATIKLCWTSKKEGPLMVW